MATYVLVLLLVACVLYFVTVYNGLVDLKNAGRKASSNLDVLLKQRHDELPKLVEACRQHMQFEQATLAGVTAARAALHEAREAGDLKGVSVAEAELRRGLGSITATVEAYPQLRADASIRTLLTRISALESEISDRREFYNECVNNLNVRIAEFPGLMVARLCSFRPVPLLEFAEAEKTDVNIRALFGA